MRKLGIYQALGQWALRGWTGQRLANYDSSGLVSHQAIMTMAVAIMVGLM